MRVIQAFIHTSIKYLHHLNLLSALPAAVRYIFGRNKITIIHDVITALV